MKSVLITGANQGIGFETAKQLAALGYSVYIGSRDKFKGDEAVEKLKSLNLNNVHCIQLDVTDIISIQSAKKQLQSNIQSLDVLINNAGIAGEQPQNISSVSTDNLRKIFDTNFFGAVQTTQVFLELLKKSDEPRIVNVSSRLSSLSIQSNAQVSNKIYDAYSASKTALNALTVLLNQELANTNFKINSVEPGYTSTNLNQFQGTQTVEQAARIIVRCATLNSDGPTGMFLTREGEEMPW